MNFKIILVYFMFFILMGCISNTDINKEVRKSLSLELELSELLYSDSLALYQAVKYLDEQYDFKKLVDRSGVNILYITSRHDSVFFDFTIVDKEYLSLFLKEAVGVRRKGFFKNKERLLFVLDEVGLFEKMSVSHFFDFGNQEFVYPIIYDVPMYRYYLKKQGTLVFIKESWL